MEHVPEVIEFIEKAMENSKNKVLLFDNTEKIIKDKKESVVYTRSAAFVLAYLISQNRKKVEVNMAKLNGMRSEQKQTKTSPLQGFLRQLNKMYLDLKD